MKKTHLFYTVQIAILGFWALTLVGCAKKTNGVDNNVVLETPYSLYFSDTSGAIYNSNDGVNYSVVLTNDGVPCRALMTSGNNLLYIKKNHCYYSSNNGVAFNHSYDTVTSYLNLADNNLPIDLNQTMIINCPEWGHMYMASASLSSENVFGMVWTLLSGASGSWYLETYYDTDEITNPHNINCTSFTELNGNGVLVAYDAHHNRVFYRIPPFSTANRWKESIRFNNDTLPDNPSLLTTGNGFFFFGHLNGQLIAVDAKGSHGGYYSNDTGKSWATISGLPANVPLLCISSPFEQTCLVGTDSAGVYLYNANTGSFMPSNNGLPKNSIVWGITFKENFYKNSTNIQYIYLATNSGIYVSVDGGLDWTQTIKGNFTAIY